ncbi:MAG: acyl carrier protein [Legionella longbeachae]|nr:acyl carrier protein [Legionella longbeachae]
MPHIAFTAQQGRAEFQERGLFIVSDDEQKYNARICSSYLHERDFQETPQVIFILSDYIIVTFDPFECLYHKYPKFKDSFDFCVGIIQDKYGIDIKIESSDSSTEFFSKCVSFSIQYAMMQLLLSTKVESYQLIAQGSGIYLAEVLAGDISFEDALVGLLAGEVKEDKSFYQNFCASTSLSLSAGSRNLVLSLNSADKPQNVDCSLDTIVHILPEKEQSAEFVFLKAIGWLWSNGLPIVWDSINVTPESSRKVRIPSYCFTKKQYVIERSNSNQTTVYNENVSVAPDLPLQDQLKDMWSKVLGVSAAELNDSSHFLELGGDSLSFIDLLKHIKTSLLIDMNLEEVIQNNEFGEMLRYISTKKVEHV